MAASDQEILGRLHKVRSLGRGNSGQDRWEAFCPAHDTHHHSLAIARFSDGGWMLKCYAGCTQDEILGAIGLNVRDLCPDSLPHDTQRRYNGKSQEYNRMVLALAKADRANGKRLSRKDKELELSAWQSLKISEAEA